MKKSYRKPLVYCENHDTGVVAANSEVYRKKIEKKLKESETKEQLRMFKEEQMGEKADI